MVHKSESSLIEKAKNQIIILSIGALATGLTMNVLFINNINLRFSSVEKTVEKLDDKIEKLDTRIQYFIEKSMGQKSQEKQSLKADF